MQRRMNKVDPTEIDERGERVQPFMVPVLGERNLLSREGHYVNPFKHINKQKIKDL
jgi:hypothetical protein